MRRWLAAVLVIGFASHAAAGDFETPVLRGSQPFIPAAPKYTRWAGFYAGGQAGYSSVEMDFSNATQALIAYLLRTTALENEQQPSQWGTLGTARPGGSSIGGFVGYNSQWDDVIVGVDIHYNRASITGNAPVSPITRVVSAGGLNYTVTVSGNASMQITDFGAARLRAGWIVNNLLPYATAGFAFGRANVSRNANVFVTECTTASPPACGDFTFTGGDGKSSAWIYGWTAGGGLDYMIMPRVFMRAEYEYSWFTRILGIDARMHTARLGAGLKF